MVNRGDSIKICGGGGRRGSQIIITPTNDVDLLGGGAGLQAPSSLRRRSVACLAASGSAVRLQPEVVGVGVSPHSRRHSFIVRQSPADGDAGGLRRRTSLRGSDRRRSNVQADRGGAIAYRVELTLGQNCQRRPSADRLSAADAPEQVIAPVNGTGSPPRSADVANDEEDADDEDDDGDDENVQVYKVMVLGSHGVGKTTLVQQLLTSEYLANVDEDRG